MAGSFFVIPDAFFLPFKNFSLFLILYAIIVALFGAIISWHGFGVIPIVLGIKHDHKAGVPVTGAELLKLGLVAGFLFLFAIAVQAKLTILTLFATTSTHKGEQLTLGEVFAKKRANKKGPLITIAIVYGFQIAISLIFGVIVGLGCYLHRKDYTPLAIVLWVLAGIFFLWFLFVILIFAVGLVVSVVEEANYGIAAIKIAKALLKPRKFQGYLLIIFLFVLDLLSKPLYGYALWLGYKEGFVLLAVLLAAAFVLVQGVLFIFFTSVATVLYYELKLVADLMSTPLIIGEPAQLPY